MSLEMLLAQFDGMIERAEDVEKLNAAILNWAVRGKLTERSPNDQPVPGLLNCVAEKREKLIKEKTIRKPKKLPKIKKQEIPFQIPGSWKWIRLGELGFAQTGTTPPTKVPENYGNDYPFVRPSDIADSLDEIVIPLDNEDGLSELGLENGRLIPKNSVLMVCIGSVGKVGYVERDCSCNQQINTLTPYVSEISGRFLTYFLSAPYFQNEAVRKSSKTTIPILNKTKWSNMLIPLPPLEEQKRIVAKVDKLLAQTRQLAAQLERAGRQRRKAFAAITRRLSDANGDGPGAAWPLLADNFDRLLGDAGTVDDLKQTILQLAVQGRLVPQDPNDEPASVRLKQIAAKKDLEIENKWRPYIPVKVICDVRGGIQKSKKRRPDKYPTRYLTVAHVQRNWIDFSDERYFEVSPEEVDKWRLLPGDNLIVEGNGSPKHIGRTAIFRGEIDVCVHQNHLIRVRPNRDLLNPEYLNLFLNSPEGREEMLKRSRTTSGLYNLSVGRIKTIHVPLPPLAEQKRIVTKVNELMALCDRLAGQLNRGQAARTRLRDAILARAV